MKLCTGCDTTKPTTEFNKNSKRADGLQPFCRVCTKQQSKDYYQRNKSKVVQAVVRRNKEYVKQRVENYQQFKQQLCCLHCGEADPICLDFHHTDPSQKDGIVSHMMASKPWDVVLQEIEKCLVLCSNCHRKEHRRLGLLG